MDDVKFAAVMMLWIVFVLSVFAGVLWLCFLAVSFSPWTLLAIVPLGIFLFCLLYIKLEK